MNSMKPRLTHTLLVFTFMLNPVLLKTASAHFPWLASDSAGHAVVWFGETIADQTYKLPEVMTDLEVHNGAGIMTMKAVNSDTFIGLTSEEPSGGQSEIHASVVYGNYHGSKLTYHVEHLPQRSPSTWPTEPREDAELQTVITPGESSSLNAVVYRDGKPMGDVEVKLFNDKGEEVGSGTTDKGGMVNLPPTKLSVGLNALLVGLTEPEQGKLDGVEYESVSTYLTSTFFVDSLDEAVIAQAIPAIDPASTASVTATDLPDLPEELTSFGAAIAGQRLFVYGGHTGAAHSYSMEEQSNRLWGLDLSKGPKGEWKELASGPRIQGLAMVAYGDKVIRIGGFSALNKEGEDQNLKSQTLVSMYNLTDDSWSELPPLPEPRSSTDAAVLDGKVYVVGGWSLNGNFESEWHSTAWSLDLEKIDQGWKEIAKQPFQRRALSLAAHHGRLYAIGGMESTNRTTTRVDIYDPATNEWSLGPSIPGSGMSGFGTAAFATGDKLYVSAMDGYVHELSGSDEKWRTITQLDPSRFFHRMLPIAKDRLILVGGANMEIGKFTDIEMVNVD